MDYLESLMDEYDYRELRMGVLMGPLLTACAAFLTVAEAEVADKAVSAFSEAVLRGGGLQAALEAFRAWAVYWMMVIVCIAAILLVAALSVALLRRRPDARALPVLVPLVIGIWALRWGLWVVS